jgi:hypothetical protein
MVVMILTFGPVEQATAQTPERVHDNATIAKDPLVVNLKVRPIDNRSLALKVTVFNPYRCQWAGYLFLEREDASGSVSTIARGYHVAIPGGTRLVGTIIVSRPPPSETHLFVARAYRPDGEDQETFVSTDLDDHPSDEVPPPDENVDGFVLGDEVLHALFETVAVGSDTIPEDQPPCFDIGADRGPVRVELDLEPDEPTVKMLGRFKNVDRRPWRGDLYVDVTSPGGGVAITRRELGVKIAADGGLSTRDAFRLGQPGLYRFAARALRRDGSARARWTDPGTTEINGVCNRELCELIRPNQTRAGLELTGRSVIHLESHFFSEFTRVTLAVNGGATDAAAPREFDITDFCEIRQNWTGAVNRIEVHFNTFDLPIGPRTWARYTIELHPMPTVPPGAKLRDSLWVLTNGGELTDSDTR